MSNVKNIRVKPVELTIDDKTYLIKYDFNAFIELEDIYGSIDEAMEKVQGEIVKDADGKPVMVKDEDGKKVEKRKINMKAMRDFLWAGLLFGNDDLQKKEVGKLLELSNLQYVISKMMEAITGALPEKVVDEKN
jgi:hypothetical protein